MIHQQEVAVVAPVAPSQKCSIHSILWLVMRLELGSDESGHVALKNVIRLRELSLRLLAQRSFKNSTDVGN
jgi:hypothetical protein